ncbi:beta-propeller domain-containing protein [bacterium]|nr:beta-propeller domain-containing protein [bacterium]
MSKVFRLLTVLVLSVCFFASCDNSSQKKSRQEYGGDGTEEFVTVGNSYENDSGKGGDYADEANADAGDAEAAPSEDGEGSAEREIVESDIYKFDGNVLWLANQYKGLIAVDIKDPEHLKILGNLRFQGYVGEMYLQEGRAYVLVSYTNSSYEYADIYYSNKTYSKLMVVNTEDPADLKLIGEFEIEGWITDSRQVGDVIYVASTEYRYYWYGCDGDGGESGADQISIMSVNVKDPKNIKMVDKVSVPGYGYTLYVSQKSIYVAEADAYYWTEDYDKGYPVTMFDISDPEGKIVKKAEFRTDGFMSDRWKMHEKGDVFYAVSSSTSWGNGDSMIETFDVSDPKNIKRLDKLIFMTDQQLYGTKFEGDRMYAVTYFQQDPLHVIDISDPANLKQLGELEVPGWSDFIEVRGTTVLAVGRDDSKTKVSMYDVNDPEDPKEINTVEIGSGYSYSEANYDWKAFKIFDELGLILLPVTDYNYDSWENIYKLYLIDFDLDKGLKTRGFIASDSYVRRGVAIQDLIFSIGENHVVLADATDRDNPKVLSEFTIASYVNSIAKCGKALCGLDNFYNFNQYDKTTGETVWTTKVLERNAYSDVNLTKNGSFAYIYRIIINSEKNDAEPAVKVVKFNDKGKFEEAGDFFLGEDTYLSWIQSASENNVLASVAEDTEWYDDYSGYKSKMRFLDMNNPEKGIKITDFDFDYESLIREKNIFAVKNTFWTSGCKLKKANENGDQYLCYALPFDAGDPKNPKEGKRVNIPGELVGISENAKYFYTKTPAIYDYDDECNDDYYCWSNSNTYGFYILKLTEDKSAAKVVAKETLTDSYGYNQNSYESVSNSVYPKNDKVFFVKTFTGENWNECSYRSSGVTEIRIVSASDGKETYKKSFENANFAMSVQDGGLLLSTHDGWTYIAPDGKEKSGDDDISSVRSYSYGDYYDYYYDYYPYNAVPQLIDGKIYIAAGWEGIYSLNVK